jgi:hypothetical protein
MYDNYKLCETASCVIMRDCLQRIIMINYLPGLFWDTVLSPKHCTERRSPVDFNEKLPSVHLKRETVSYTLCWELDTVYIIMLQKEPFPAMLTRLWWHYVQYLYQYHRKWVGNLCENFHNVIFSSYFRDCHWRILEVLPHVDHKPENNHFESITIVTAPGLITTGKLVTSYELCSA